MKERPILFSGAMVRAILSGQKTQTRRVVKHKWLPKANGKPVPTDVVVRAGDPPFMYRETCPYGQPGDRLWVRETWQGPLWDEDGPFPENGYTPEYCEYRADEGNTPWFVDADGNEHNCWRPSIHMPRWACRIVLEIVSVRVERLQDISEADAKAEGILADSFEHNGQLYFRDYRLSDAEASTQPALKSPIESFRSLWESINGPESWLANHWVWVVEFKRVQQ